MELLPTPKTYTRDRLEVIGFDVNFQTKEVSWGVAYGTVDANGKFLPVGQAYTITYEDMKEWIARKRVNELVAGGMDLQQAMSQVKQHADKRYADFFATLLTESQSIVDKFTQWLNSEQMLGLLTQKYQP